MIWRLGLLGALCLLVGRWTMALDNDDLLAEVARLCSFCIPFLAIACWSGLFLLPTSLLLLFCSLPHLYRATKWLFIPR